MKYNDNQIINNYQSQILSESYQKSENEKSQDLIELYEKIKEQREYMSANNSDHSLDNLIETTNKHLDSLNTIIKATSYSSNTKSQQKPNKTIAQLNIYSQPYGLPHYRPYINSPTSEFPQNSIHNIGDLPNENIPNIDNSNNFNNLPNTNNNVPNIDNNYQEQPQLPQNNNQSNLPNSNNNEPNLNNSNGNQPNNTNNNQNNNPNNLPNTNNNVPNIDNSNNLPNNRNRQRNSPLQNNILSNIVKSLFGKRVKSKQIMTDDNHRNRFHNTFIQVNQCNPHNKLITNECNILRLLLLYITLNPHCRFVRSLSTISNERLEILMKLM